MERQTILEFMRMVLIAFVIAFVINFFRIAIFGNINDEPRFENITEPDQAPQESVNNYRTNDYPQSDPTINPYLSGEVVDIPISPMQNFSGLSKNRIVEKRIEAVGTSPIFSHLNYSPSANFFQIKDGAPWISANGALHWSNLHDSEKITGVSRDSVGILNPELLYYIALTENEDCQRSYKVLYKDFYFIPYKVKYTPRTKTITAYIKNDRVEGGKYQPICLSDSNANDLGYKYAYMDSYTNVGFYRDGEYNNNYLTSGVKETKGYYMHGPACGLPGGCNNYAPYWSYYNYFYLKDLPATVHIKLWKHYPYSVSQEADINFEMIFE